MSTPASREMTPRPAERPAAALEIDGVSHAYGQVVAVDRVGLAIADREIVGLVGPSGCGKSTLLRLAAGLEELQAGEIRIRGATVARPGRAVPPERRGVGLVFQDYALFPHLSVLENVAFGLSGLSMERRRARAAETLEQVGMRDSAASYPHMLSGGQQQRVALARALAPRPGVLLLDEPFSGLDTVLRNQVRDETLHVLKQAGTATLIVTHDPEEAMFLADRIALMRDGRIVQMGEPVDLYCRPMSPFVARFFGEVNRIAGRVDRAQVRTPVGTLDAADFADGTSVEVLIRPEALSLSLGPVNSGAKGRVGAARLLGRTSLIHLEVPDGRGGSLHVHARMPGPFLPPEDTTVSIRLDGNQAFVFAADDVI